MPKITLNAEAKIYIVTRLACFAAPTVVIREVQEEWKVKLSTAAIAHYNPLNFQGRDLADELKQLFYETRAKYVEGVQDVGIANKRHRLEVLQRVAEQAEDEGSNSILLATLKQAREEVEGKATGASGDAQEGDGPATGAGKDVKADVETLKKLPQNELVERYQNELKV